MQTVLVDFVSTRDEQSKKKPLSLSSENLNNGILD